MKAGYKTTEFWIGLVPQLLGAAMASGIIPSQSQVGQIVGLVVSALGSLGYTAQRGILKAKLK
jgi:hypothetical protein